MCRDVHKDSGKEDFLGIVTVDMAALLFGVTAGWYELQENVDLRGPEVSARSRLRLGQIRPMQPIQGAIYLEMEATNPVSHLPKPPPQDPIEIYEEEVMAQVMEENRGASRRRRKMIIKDMWDKLLVDNPRAIEGYTEQVSTLHDDHIERMNNQVCTHFCAPEVALCSCFNTSLLSTQAAHG